MSVRNMLVIGAGRFGGNLARKLTELGNEVLVIDVDEQAINEIAPYVTRAEIGNCMDKNVLLSLGVRNFDVCFVCIGANFQSSLEITSLLKEIGAAKVVSKTDRDIQAGLLLKIGADEVINPERDMAKRTAVRYSASGAFDYVELSDDYAIFEIQPPKAWINHSIKDLDVRSNHNVNVIGIREGEKVLPVLSAEHVFAATEHVIIAGERKSILGMMNQD
jgi:trk system potassium uptake protein TrkA